MNKAVVRQSLTALIRQATYMLDQLDNELMGEGLLADTMEREGNFLSHVAGIIKSETGKPRADGR